MVIISRVKEGAPQNGKLVQLVHTGKKSQYTYTPGDEIHGVDIAFLKWNEKTIHFLPLRKGKTIEGLAGMD